MNRPLATIALGGVLVVLGLLCGWYAARQDTAAAEEAAHAAAPRLTPQALANLGVAVGAAELEDFVATADVLATVVDAPLNARPLAAPLGGIVTELHTGPGDVVEPGAPVATIARAPIPRVTLALTADILTPVSENLHESVSRLRLAAAQHRIAERELARVRGLLDADGGLPVIPRQRVVELEYDVVRTGQQRANAEHELERHGLAAKEIAAVLDGAETPAHRHLWRRALEKNGLWGAPETAVFDALPEVARARPWSVAAIGELSAAGLANARLADALKETPALAAHFVEAASLLLSGHSVAHVTLLARQGALEPRMVVRAPAHGAPWDVESIAVRMGVHVEPGDTIATLHDPTTMWLRLEPVGAEAGAVARAAAEGTRVRATPLVAGNGPVLDDLAIARLATRADQEHRGALAVAVARNTATSGPGGRTWALRVGQRYVVHVPRTVLPQRFVLPASAVTNDGAERVVFLEDGKTFRPQSVHVEYENDEVVVIAHDGAIFPGDRVVRTGAFALGLALQTSGGPVDMHAGHSH